MVARLRRQYIEDDSMKLYKIQKKEKRNEQFSQEIGTRQHVPGIRKKEVNRERKKGRKKERYREIEMKTNRTI